MATSMLAHLPASLAQLEELALDLRWTWSHEGDDLWRHIDADLWDRAHSPWTVLQHVPAARLQSLAADSAFQTEFRGLIERRAAYLDRQTWMDSVHPEAGPGRIAFFSMEFGLGEALPLYAGGLGILAGDFLKGASDMGVPVVGVGLLYQEGYFRQTIDADGLQHETYAYNEPASMPISPVMTEAGERLRIGLDLPGRTLMLRVWRAAVGLLTLYLLDSNDPLNSPADRGVTGQLYGGDGETRLLQEVVLGIGGWRMLEALGVDVQVCHINEGHAALVVLERARTIAARDHVDYWQAFWTARAGNVFTTHTPVADGFDRFRPELLRRYLPSMEAKVAPLGASIGELLALGRADPGNADEPFNMAYLAMRGSARSFAVSRLHGQSSRRIFQPLFPRWPEIEVPVGHVTNGVHAPTWDSAEADRIWTESCGKGRWHGRMDELPDQIQSQADEDLWRLRGHGRQDLVEHVRRRFKKQLRAVGYGAEAANAEQVLDPNVLTLGFARRFTEYKRPNLLLRDRDRLARLLLNEHRPAQIVVAGKAHPADLRGKAMIREWIDAARDPALRQRVVFLEDYDMALAQELVQGVDVWINTPRRPWEACGTSGMKVLVNGGLNLSVRDGWWDEAFAPDLGWAIGDGLEPHDIEQADAADALALYTVLESEVAPEFYDRDETGLPRAWLQRIRRSMSDLTPRFSSTRMVREYVEEAYLPSAAAFTRRLAGGQAVSKDLQAWSERLRRGWPTLHLGVPTVGRVENNWRYSVPVMLGEVSADDVRVELFAEPDGLAQTFPLKADHAIPGDVAGFVFVGEAPASRAAEDYSVRVVPRHAEAILPAELPLILWQR